MNTPPATSDGRTFQAELAEADANEARFLAEATEAGRPVYAPVDPSEFASIVVAAVMAKPERLSSCSFCQGPTVSVNIFASVAPHTINGHAFCVYSVCSGCDSLRDDALVERLMEGNFLGLSEIFG